MFSTNSSSFPISCNYPRFPIISTKFIMNFFFSFFSFLFLYYVLVLVSLFFSLSLVIPTFFFVVSIELVCDTLLHLESPIKLGLAQKHSLARSLVRFFSPDSSGVGRSLSSRSSLSLSHFLLPFWPMSHGQYGNTRGCD